MFWNKQIKKNLNNFLLILFCICLFVLDTWEDEEESVKEEEEEEGRRQIKEAKKEKETEK